MQQLLRQDQTGLRAVTQSLGLFLPVLVGVAERVETLLEQVPEEDPEQVYERLVELLRELRVVLPVARGAPQEAPRWPVLLPPLMAVDLAGAAAQAPGPELTAGPLFTEGAARVPGAE